VADREPDIRLGQFTERAEDYVGRGVFESIDEQRDFNEMIRAKVAEALADPRQATPIDEAFDRIRQTIRAKHHG
jgi:hypothetical protein